MSKHNHTLEARSPRKLAKAERRQWVRYGSTLEVSIRRLGSKDDASWSGELRDVSAVGAGVVSQAAVDPGALLEVRPLYRILDFTSKLMMRVRKSAELPTGGWLLGCTFVRELSETEFARLL
jgi:c-di-GMP-binding flagellar brake protein YcgR